MSVSAAGLMTGALPRDRLTQYAFGFAFLSSFSVLLSIAVSHACLAIALLLLLLSKTPVRMPPVVWPLLGFLGLTLVSMLASDDPASGWPQVKKIFVFSILPVVFSLFPRHDQARRLMEAWFVCALAAAVLSVVQFFQKVAAARAAGEDFHDAYVHHRITGFYSHWITFSEVGLLVFLVLLAYLMFSTRGRRYGAVVWLTCGAVLGLALALSFTRSLWLAAPIGVAYLIWHWNRRLLPAVPLLLLVVALAAPGAVQRRLESMVNPGANQARVIMARTGLRMIESHPWLGIGPERVGPRFREFMPGEIEELPDAYYGHVHNMYIQYAAERGLPALLLLLWLLGKAWWDHRQALRTLPPRLSEERFLLHAVVVSTLAVGIVGCFDYTLGDSEILGVYLTLIALGYRTVERVARRAKPLQFEKKAAA